MASSEAQEKQVMMVGIDESDQSIYALEWVVDHFFASFAPNYPFQLLIVHAKPTVSSVIGLLGPGSVTSFRQNLLFPSCLTFKNHILFSGRFSVFFLLGFEQ
uniref:UspA domain-containing protein n=1 Tax=Rhizophora mucronata TaxID=61149 RepID=A0A2P2M1C6_RHIMU